MKIVQITGIITIVTALTGLGWWGSETFAKSDEVALVATKAEIAMDGYIENLQAELTLLESKPNKTAYDRDRIKYLRGKIERLKKIRDL